MVNIPPVLKIHLLGSFRVSLHGEKIDRFDADSARALLAWLVLQQDHAHQRPALANLLWCEQPAESSLRNLRSALNRVRKALGDSDERAQPFILADRQSIQWNPHCPVWVDVIELVRLLSAIKSHAHHRLTGCPWCIEQLTQVAGLYGGELLADLRIESLAFDEWRQLEREYLHRSIMQSLYLLAESHQKRGEFDLAEHYARRQIASERWNEEAHQQLMGALYASGQRSAALAQYESCRGILEAEFGVAPQAETTALYGEICRCERNHRRHHASPLPDKTSRSPAVERQINTLPQPLTSFVHREEELNELLKQIVNPAHRLTTVVGSGGVGKTRLALAAAHKLVHSFEDGVYFVRLADIRATTDPATTDPATTDPATTDPATTDPATTEATLLAEICQALQLEPTEAAATSTQLINHLRHRELLVVLDNVEHLLAGVALLYKIMQSAPGVTFLVTSRQPVGFQSEHLLRLHAFPPQQAADFFVERTRSIDPDFTPTPRQRALIDEICSHLQGHPLSIELAVAQLRQHSLTAVCILVKQGAGNLVANLPDLPERHHSLQAVFQDTWQLLTPAEQQVLQRIARTPDTLDPTCTDLPQSVLASLRNKSVLVQENEQSYHLPMFMRSLANYMVMILSL